MHYLSYHFTVTPSQPGSEILMAMIAEYGFESFEMSENGFTAYINEDKNANLNFSDLIFEDFKYEFKIEKITQVNWNEEWEKNFQPVVIENLLQIRAPFHPTNKNVKHEIVIMPKMSFGTGHHQTTQLMCKAMCGVTLTNKRILDMGCGTGVLAILAKKLGAKEVLAIDLDEWSVENSIENCAANSCADINVKQGDIDLIKNEAEFDFILANINKNILKTHLSVYSEKLNQGGILFISGFFKSDVEELANFAITQNLKFKSQNVREEWAMVILEK